nr:unnamed protein product [Callosobruchus chinensis]
MCRAEPEPNYEHKESPPLPNKKAYKDPVPINEKKIAHVKKVMPHIQGETLEFYYYVTSWTTTNCRNLQEAIPLSKLLIENNVTNSFQETKKLLKMLITIPMSPIDRTAEAERSFSTLKRVKTFLRNTMVEERLVALSMLSMEKKIVILVKVYRQTHMTKMDSGKMKRMRGSNFSKEEELLLARTVAIYKNTIECKMTDKCNNQEKNEAWKKVTEHVNANCTKTRTLDQLKMKYENLKAKARKMVALQRSCMTGTGGGPAQIPESDPVLETIISLINKKTVVGLHWDGDNQITVIIQSTISPLFGTTNKFICASQRIATNPLTRSSRLTRWVETTPNELRMFVGLLLHMGPCSFPSIEHYWSQNIMYKMPFWRFSAQAEIVSRYYYVFCILLITLK